MEENHSQLAGAVTVPDAPDVFVSYSRRDQDRVKGIVEALTARGLTVWWDSELNIGDVYRKEIDAALTAAHAVLVAWSETSVGSSWVREEADEALKTRRLFPVLLDQILPPRGFREIQSLDLTKWNGNPNDEIVQKLALTIKAFVDRKKGTAADQAKEPGPEIVFEEDENDLLKGQGNTVNAYSIVLGIFRNTSPLLIVCGLLAGLVSMVPFVYSAYVPGIATPIAESEVVYQAAPISWLGLLFAFAGAAIYGSTAASIARGAILAADQTLGQVDTTVVPSSFVGIVSFSFLLAGLFSLAIRDPLLPSTPSSGLQLSQDGSIAAVWTPENVSIVGVSDGKVRNLTNPIQQPRGSVYLGAWFVDGDARIATVSAGDWAVRTYDAKTGAPLSVGKLPDGRRITGLYIGGDGAMASVRLDDGSRSIFDFSPASAGSPGTLAKGKYGDEIAPAITLPSGDGALSFSAVAALDASNRRIAILRCNDEKTECAVEIWPVAGTAQKAPLFQSKIDFQFVAPIVTGSKMVFAGAADVGRAPVVLDVLTGQVDSRDDLKRLAIAREDLSAGKLLAISDEAQQGIFEIDLLTGQRRLLRELENGGDSLSLNADRSLALVRNGNGVLLFKTADWRPAVREFRAFVSRGAGVRFGRQPEQIVETGVGRFRLLDTSNWSSTEVKLAYHPTISRERLANENSGGLISTEREEIKVQLSYLESAGTSLSEIFSIVGASLLYAAMVAWVFIMLAAGVRISARWIEFAAGGTVAFVFRTFASFLVYAFVAILAVGSVGVVLTVLLPNMNMTAWFLDVFKPFAVAWITPTAIVSVAAFVWILLNACAEIFSRLLGGEANYIGVSIGFGLLFVAILALHMIALPPGSILWWLSLTPIVVIVASLARAGLIWFASTLLQSMIPVKTRDRFILISRDEITTGWR